MRIYFYQGSYTAEAWAKLVADPKDVLEVMKPSIDRFGGKVIACFLTVAGAEPAGFMEFPDDVSAAAWGIHLKSQGLVKDLTLVPVMPTADGLEAMKRVGGGGGTGGGGW